MSADATSCLWPEDGENFFREKGFQPVQQSANHCVAASLAILTGETEAHFQGKVNTQNPVSWSDALRRWSMKLAYCPTDVRKLEHYMKELVRHDDLFALSYYTRLEPAEILGEPDRSGWVTGSHIVILHRDQILDPAKGTSTKASDHSCRERHTKRIFRVVPADHARGL